MSCEGDVWNCGWRETMNWEHEVLMFIDRTGADYSYDKFLWLVDNAAWCPKCEKVNDCDGGPHFGNDEICDECVEVTA